MTERRTLLASVALAGSALLWGCSGENLFTTAALVNAAGEYEAVAILVEDGMGDVVDLTARGATFSLDLDETDRTFRSVFRYLDLDATVTGGYELEGRRIIFGDDPFQDDDRITERAMDFLDEGDRLVLRDLETALDLDRDGFLETAELRVILTRR